MAGFNHPDFPDSALPHLLMTEATHESSTSAELPEIHKALILVTVSTCTMLYAMTMTIVNVALPQLQGALSATPDQIAWVITLNVVATAVVTPMTGWLVARLGQRRLMLGTVVGFAISSLLCATAATLEPLLVWRVGQGIFGAPIVPLSQAILLAAYPGKDRAMAQGFFGMAVVIGPAVAPALGGYLAEAATGGGSSSSSFRSASRRSSSPSPSCARRGETRRFASTGPDSSPCRSPSSASSSWSIGASASTGSNRARSSSTRAS